FSYGLADVVAVDSSHQPPWRHTVTYSRLEFRDASMDPYAHALQHVGITRHREAHAPASESGENLIALLTQSDIISALVARTCRGIRARADPSVGRLEECQRHGSLPAQAAVLGPKSCARLCEAVIRSSPRREIQQQSQTIWRATATGSSQWSWT